MVNFHLVLNDLKVSTNSPVFDNFILTDKTFEMFGKWLGITTVEHSDIRKKRHFFPFFVWNSKPFSQCSSRIYPNQSLDFLIKLSVGIRYSIINYRFVLPNTLCTWSLLKEFLIVRNFLFQKSVFFDLPYHSHYNASGITENRIVCAQLIYSKDIMRSLSLSQKLHI